MSGLSGFITPKEISKDSLCRIGRAMRAPLTPRGPDGWGEWTQAGPHNFIFFGYTRLAVLDLTDQGKQPMRSQSGRYVLIYNGEIYNFVSLREELRDTGVTFRGRSDSEVVLAAIDIWGLNATLQKIKGMFSLVVLDQHTQEIHFARDIFGEKPLYIGWVGEDLVFASELTSFQAHPSFKPELDMTAFSGFMHFGYIQAPYSIFKDVLCLPAGFRLSVGLEKGIKKQDLSKKIQPYWNLKERFEEKQSLGGLVGYTEKDYLDELEQELKLSVNRCMFSDVPYGALLSNTPASFLITAMAQNLSARRVDSFEVDFTANHKETLSERVANQLETRHTKISVSASEMADISEELIAGMGEPFANPKSFCDAAAFKYAREKVSILLGDIGSQELFAGYNRHVFAPDIWQKYRGLPRIIRRFLMRLPSQLLQDMSGADNAIAQLNALEEALHANDAHRLYNQILQRDPAVKLALTDEVGHSTRAFGLQDEERWQPEEAKGFMDRMIYWDLLSYLPNMRLVGSDRFSMAYSLEMRAPFLDKAIVEYAMRLPAYLKVRHGQGAYILKALAHQYLPEDLLRGQSDKPDFAYLLRDHLREPMEEVITNLNPSLFQVKSIEKLWHDHCDEQRQNHTHLLWRIYVFQTWFKEMTKR